MATLHDVRIPEVPKAGEKELQTLAVPEPSRILLL